jgi:sulfate permease, SulP family
MADFLAGLTTGVMLIPQGMAYAMMASLPPIMGLYTATIAPFFFAFLGTSQQLSVGPVALVGVIASRS